MNGEGLHEKCYRPGWNQEKYPDLEINDKAAWTYGCPVKCQSHSDQEEYARLEEFPKYSYRCRTRATVIIEQGSETILTRGKYDAATSPNGHHRSANLAKRRGLTYK